MLDLVRGKQVDEALATLKLLTSPWSKPIYKVVHSAAANAENNMFMSRDGLRIVHISADPARPLKRFRARARGRIGQITRRSCHITVIVDQPAEEDF
jgi:large subunit ribosomal protein L22